MNWTPIEKNALEGPFISPNILSYILKNIQCRNVLVDEADLLLTVYFFADSRNIDEITSQAKHLVRIIKDFQRDYNLASQDRLVVMWFPTPILKTLPNGDKLSLDVEEINSACTNHSPGERFIALYRQEEVAKVIYHELVHFYRLDQPLTNNYDQYIKQKYSIKIPCILKETYSEVLGCLLNTERVSMETKIPFQVLYSIELAFMTYQAQKVLGFFNVNGIDELPKLKSDTNLITYFIFKLAFLLSQENIMDYLQTIKADRLVMKMPEKFVSDIERGLGFLFSLERITDIFPGLKKTMRMTIVEM